MRCRLNLRDDVINLARMLAQLRPELVDVEESGSDRRSQLFRFAIQKLELVVDMTTVLLADVAHERLGATVLLKTREFYGLRVNLQ